MSAVVEKDRCGHVFVWRKLNFDHLLLVLILEGCFKLIGDDGSVSIRCKHVIAKHFAA